MQRERKSYKLPLSYDNHTHSVPDRIVSVSQPFVRPIVRGKAGKPVVFGMKLDISIQYAFLQFLDWLLGFCNRAKN